MTKVRTLASWEHDRSDEKVSSKYYLNGIVGYDPQNNRLSKRLVPDHNFDRFMSLSINTVYCVLYYLDHLRIVGGHRIHLYMHREYLLLRLIEGRMWIRYFCSIIDIFIFERHPNYWSIQLSVWLLLYNWVFCLRWYLSIFDITNWLDFCISWNALNRIKILW